MSNVADDGGATSGTAVRADGTDEVPRGTTLWRRIADDIETEIRTGQYSGGSALPPVVALADRFGVNRHTVRQSLQFLQTRGLVSIEQGRGTFVRARRFDYRLERRVRFRNNFSETDTVLAGEVVSFAVEPVGATDGALLDLPPDSPAWTFRILRNVDGAPLSTSIQRLPADRFPGFDRVLDRTDPSVTAAFRRYGIADYVRLSTRIAASMPTPGEQALLHLDHDEPVLRTRGVDGTPDGRPFHLTTTTFVAERIEFVFEPNATAPASST